MEKVEAFKASDGSLFSSVELCQEHEMSLLWRERVNDYIKSPLNTYTSGQHNGMIAKIIVNWERYKTGA